MADPGKEMAILVPRRSFRLCVSVLICGVIIGPWPADRSAYDVSPAYLGSLGRLSTFPGKVTSGPIRVGVAEVDLVPSRAVPLAGFIGQIATPYVGVNSACSAKALTVTGRNFDVTILAADLLLIEGRLARAILGRTGLRPDQIYFTATHTHSGPGGWGNHPLERLVAGSFDPAVFDELAARLAEAVLQSRRRPQPAEVAFVQVAVPGLQRNRILTGQPTNDTLSAWIFRGIGTHGPGPVLATFASFGAHATIAHPVPPRLGGDYPAAFAAALPRLVDAGVVLFAAGTVGDSSPVRPPAATHQGSATAYGVTLAASLAPRFATARFATDAALANVRLEVDLPPVQLPCFAASLRFSPWIVGWISNRRTHLHVLRIGPAVLVGFPGDYSGHLGRGLDGPLPVVATSFNGDYKGYLVARSTFENQPCYETRWMSFFGPDLGAMLTDLARRTIARVAGLEPGSAR